MVSEKQDIHAIFNEAIVLASEEDRLRYLDQACGGDLQMRARVDALLHAHSEAGDFFGGKSALDATKILPITESPGTVIGPYKLLQQVGEGGMGVVFMAEQSEPLQRTVALKIIKPGMDTRQVIARFEAERQAVAMMDHPNIAKVLDAGTTDSGRPYFVMELVKGVPITNYCDEKCLPLPARLELFVQVCQAVQHAHQKGIIHRDIKPNNLLVAEYDNRAVPKVIDFGVAKATAQRLTERTMFTEFGQVLGTMEYMSPEQSKFNQLDIDTRSDIYSLGVLLYELLAGSTPFEGKRLHAAAYDEMLRIIREEEPPKPSTRLSSIDTLPSVAVNRHTEPARLSKDVRGELDWIVMKALEKDRNRRYETASGFAADIERHLHDEPVEAGPPSAGYRLRKLARRHLAALFMAVLVTMLLVSAIIILAISNAQFRQESAAKRKALIVASFAADRMLFRVANDKLGNTPEATSLRLDLMRDAITYFESLLGQLPHEWYLQYRTATVWHAISYTQRDLGQYDDARQSMERCIGLLEQLVAEHPEEPKLLERLARAEQQLAYTWEVMAPGENEETISLHYEKAYGYFSDLLNRHPQRHPPMAIVLRRKAEVAQRRGELVEAERRWREAIRRGEDFLEHAPESPDWQQLEPPNWESPEIAKDQFDVQVSSKAAERLTVCWAITTLGSLLRDQNRFDEAEEIIQSGIRHGETLLTECGGSAIGSARAVNAALKLRLATIYQRQGRFDDAAHLFVQAVEEIESLCAKWPQNKSYWIATRHFHEEIIKGLQEAGRRSEAQVAVRNMYDWLQKLAPRVPNESEPQKELRDTQWQVIRFLRATSQETEANELLQVVKRDNVSEQKPSPDANAADKPPVEVK